MCLLEKPEIHFKVGPDGGKAALGFLAVFLYRIDHNMQLDLDCGPYPLHEGVCAYNNSFSLDWCPTNRFERIEDDTL